MATSSARSQRTIVEECLKWISQRKAFGKPLASQAVIRSKVAAMIARVESVQSWLENITHQMNNMVRLLQLEHIHAVFKRRNGYSRTRSRRSTLQDQLPCLKCMLRKQRRKRRVMLCRSSVDVELRGRGWAAS